MPRKKIVEEEPEEVFEWDKKKIAIAIIILALLVVGAVLYRKFILGDTNVPAAIATHQSVQGANTTSPSGSVAAQNPASLLPPQSDLQQQLKALQQKVDQLSLKDVASSSPQVQQVIQQLQQLPSLPGSVAKQTCEQLCGKL